MEIPIGPEAKASLDLVDGKVVGSVKYQGADAAVSLDVTFDAKPLAQKLGDELKKVIPGTIDDTLIDAAIAAVFK